MTYLMALLGALLMVSGTSGDIGRGDSASLPCPGEVPRTRALVEKLLTEPAYETARQEVNLIGVQPAQVRLLTDATDANTCWALNAKFGGAGASGRWQWSYYNVGDKYFVVMQYAQSGNTFRAGLVPLIILDGNLNQVGGYAM
jgi:hypothetical protein